MLHGNTFIFVHLAMKECNFCPYLTDVYDIDTHGEIHTCTQATEPNKAKPKHYLNTV